mmetsp:Transcript_797/g.1499  ORF Transcript_797/g.1499 Transcript_797/m.1499 type:complete len:244 (+) Transcript_797:136-867(+)
MHSPNEFGRVITRTSPERTPPMVMAQHVPHNFVDSECPSNQDVVNNQDFVIPTESASSRPHDHDSERQGGLCCGGWCDYRRATIYAVFAEAVTSLLWILAFYVDSFNLIYASDITDRGMMQIINDSNHLHAVVYGITVVSSFLAFVSALQFKLSAIIWNIVWILLSFVAGILIRIRTTENLNLYNASYEYTTNWFAIILTAVLSALFIYPQIAFIHEVNAGVLNQHTYSRESYSCCCRAERKW